MKWHEALTVWNRTKKEIDASHVWAVPRKGTSEYRDVYNIIIRAKPGAVAERNEERANRAAEQLKAVQAAAKARRDAAAAPAPAPAPEEEPAPTRRSRGTVKDAVASLELEEAYKKFLDTKSGRERATVRQRLRYYLAGEERAPLSKDEAIRRVMRAG